MNGSSYSKLNASQAMVDAGCAALFEDEDKLSKQSAVRRKRCNQPTGVQAVQHCAAVQHVQAVQHC